jgi:hypothetical protein
MLESVLKEAIVFSIQVIIQSTFYYIFSSHSQLLGGCS